MPDHSARSVPPAPRTLPEKASLEQLKKQAKDLLKAYLSGKEEALELVHAYERKPDLATFALHDAQRVLARSYGFESWSKLKARVERITVARLADGVRLGDERLVRALLRRRPELVNMEMADYDEHMALHHAVLARRPEMVRVLMEAGANARKGIWPHRDATTAYTLAAERGFDEIVAIIDEEEQRRREELSCPNATVSPAQEQLNAAIRSGDDAAAFTLLETDPSLLRACDRDGATPLHVAAAMGNETLAAWMLDRRANPRKKDAHGLTPLDHAALAFDPRAETTKPFPAVARLLLSRGAPMTIRAAVALGDVETVREFAEAEPAVIGRELNARGGLLTLAVKHGQLDVIRLLLDLGADVDERITLPDLEEPIVSWGNPLWHAARLGRIDIAELLLDRGADPNANPYASGWPIDHAYKQKNEHMKQLLRSRGARPQPWSITVAHDLEEAQEMLATDSSQEVARELAWGACLNGCPEILAFALPRLDWPTADERWHWFLVQPIRGHDRAAHDGLFACMEILLRRGIDANVLSRRNDTVLHYLAADGDPTEEQRVRMGRLLLDAGARLDIRDQIFKSTPLGWAARWGRTGLVKLLLERGAPADEPDAEPWATPLAWAMKKGHADVAEFLRAWGAVAG